MEHLARKAQPQGAAPPGCAVCGVRGLRPWRGSTALQALRHFRSGSGGEGGRAHTSDRGKPGLCRPHTAEDSLPEGGGWLSRDVLPSPRGRMVKQGGGVF